MERERREGVNRGRGDERKMELKHVLEETTGYKESTSQLGTE